MRFFDNLPVRHVANELNMAESTIFLQQRSAIEKLAIIIETQERQARSEIKHRLARRLPLASYNQLVGVEALLERLLAIVQRPGPPWIISIEGMGGIGKTSVADALLRRVIELGLFAEVAWVNSQPARLTLAGEILRMADAPFAPDDLMRRLLNELMPEMAHAGGLTSSQVDHLLQSRLHETPHCIVVDNLETVADLENLMPTLTRLANPTKFVLTTRESLYGQPSVFPISVPDLNQTNALDLIRQEANWTNLPEVAAAHDDVLRPIYETVGGNPLALRLVVGQLHVYSLEDIIQDLREARGSAIDNLYTYIYRHAWASLDELSQQALLAMSLLPLEGDTLAFLGQICQLDPTALRSSIQRLATLNLVEVHGDLRRRVYSIHSLTRTFLLEQVAKWM
jgi:LuxR family glucitol operon transcriptional activator